MAYPSPVCNITHGHCGNGCDVRASQLGWGFPALASPFGKPFAGGLPSSKNSLVGGQCACAWLRASFSCSPCPVHGRATSPGCRGAEKQVPEELAKEPGREAAPAGALAEVAEVAGELAQEQRLGLRQGWGGQQGSGSLAALLQAWGLCSRGETGEKVSLQEAGASPCVSWRPGTYDMSCGTSLLPTEPPKNPDLNLFPQNHDCCFAVHPFPQTRLSQGTQGMKRRCPGGGCQPHLPTHSTPGRIVGGLQHVPPHCTAREGASEAELLTWQGLNTPRYRSNGELQDPCPGAQQGHREGRAKETWGNGHQLEDLPNLKGQPSPTEKASWEGKGFLGEKKLHLG